MEPKQYYIGIDVGGTSVKEGLFDEDGNLLAKASQCPRLPSLTLRALPR